jgi:F-type H+-transporting ATPase subunit a
MGPIHQFEMINLFPIAKIGNVEIAFTNSAPVRFQALAEMTYEFVATTLQRSAGPEKSS